MSLLIGSAITIVGVEISMFVISSLRQSRTIDHSAVAYYAAETGAESLMHQVRKEDLTSFANLRKKTETIEGATWSVAEYIESDTVVGVFRDSAKELQRAALSASDSIQISLYKKDGQGYTAIPDLKSLKVAWSTEACGEQRPSIELTAIEFSGGATIDWNSPNTQLKKDIQIAPVDDPSTELNEADSKEAYFNLVKDDGTLINKPMIVRIKGYFCDLSGVSLTLFSDLDGSGTQLDIPNYFYINPKGVFSGVARTELKSIFAADTAASSVFDFVVFSQDQIVK